MTSGTSRSATRDEGRKTGSGARQLTLIPAQSNWQLDAKTKETGRRGIAAARRALAAHRPTDQPARRAS